MEYLLANDNTTYTAAIALFKEYAQSIGINLGFQHFDKELSNVQQMYAPPQGCLIVCKVGSDYVGCIGLRPLSPAIGELKRMYVQPAHGGRGIGQQLLLRAIAQAKILGYTALRLDTLASMHTAVHLYRKNGFYTIGAYYPNPLPNILYFEKIL